MLCFPFTVHEISLGPLKFAEHVLSRYNVWGKINRLQAKSENIQFSRCKKYQIR